MMSHEAWERLGISETADPAVIRKAYAALVRQYRPDSHPVEFAAIRLAYEEALRMARDDADMHRGAPEITLAHELPPAQRQEPSSTGRTGPYDWNLDAEGTAVRQAMDRGDDATLFRWLDDSFAKARNGTFDAMRDFEAFLITALLTHPAPPPAFVEACADRLKWPTRWMMLAETVGEGACLRLRGLLQLAVDYRFSRNFSANPWHRRLFSKAPMSSLAIGWTPLLQRAGKAAEQWQQQCLKFGFTGYLKYLNDSVVLHLNGQTVQSCDIKHAILIAIYAMMITYRAPDMPPALWLVALAGIAAFAVASVFRPLWRRARATFQLDQALSWARKLGLALCLVTFLCGLADRELSAILWLETPLFILKKLSFTCLLGVLLWIHWWLVWWYESNGRVFKLRKLDHADDDWWARERGEADQGA